MLDLLGAILMWFTLVRGEKPRYKRTRPHPFAPPDTSHEAQVHKYEQFMAEVHAEEARKKAALIETHPARPR